MVQVNTISHVIKTCLELRPEATWVCLLRTRFELLEHLLLCDMCLLVTYESMT